MFKPDNYYNFNKVNFTNKIQGKFSKILNPKQKQLLK